MIMRIPIIALLTATFAATSSAADSENARALYERHCVACHGTEVYTREDRKITSLPSLKNQVRRCETALELRWFDEDIDDVSQFLNEHYYRFKL